MKTFHSIILAGLIVHFLPLQAENFLEEETPSFVSQEEVATLASIDEEFSLLDEEFEEFKEELSILENVSGLPSAPAEIAPVIEQLPSIVLVDAEIPSPLSSEKTAVAFAAPEEFEETALFEEELSRDVPATLNVQEVAMVEKHLPLKSDVITVDLHQAFSGSPIIYSLLLSMSVFSVCIWLYSLLSMNTSARVPHSLLKNVQNKLNSNHFDEALALCQDNKGLFCKMLLSGIHARRHGLPVMIETMKAEGKRSTIAFWQKIGLLNDIAIIAPMLGLLGTVLGMFYAFYDVNRSIESVSSLFDGLGISVGTTVAGLIVAILALILHSTAKFRLVRMLARVENEAQSVAMLVDDRTSITKG